MFMWHKHPSGIAALATSATAELWEQKRPHRHIIGPGQGPAHAESSGCTRETEERIDTRRISRSLAALRVSSSSNLSGSVAGILPPAPAQTLRSCVMQLI